MRKNVWLTVHGEQQYEGLAPDSLEQRLPGTLEETADGVRIRYEERNADGAVVTVTSLDMADGGVVLTRMGEVTSEMVFRPGEARTSSYATAYGTLPVTVETESVKWKFDERGGMLALRYRIDLSGQKGNCALRIRARMGE
jgi:uncharacterized beta-barrel protein YwiB (DUF1934 family)